jgi:lon-related putative ATP-dependent protease
MFFKRPPQEKPQALVTETVARSAPGVTDSPGISVAQLRRRVDAAALGFKTTAELTPLDGLVGQDRALRAIEFGFDMKASDYHVFVMGPPATGKVTAVKAHLATRARAMATASDWVYVHDFDEPNRPRAIALPAGRAKPLARSMIAVIDELREVVPALFEGEDYQARRRSIEEGYRLKAESALEVLSQKAATQNIALMRTPTGFAMAPMLEGKVVKPEVFAELPDDMKREVERKVEALQQELQRLLEQGPKLDKQRRTDLAKLNEEVAQHAVTAAIEDVATVFDDLPDVKAYLTTVASDLVRNIAVFVMTSDEPEIVRQPTDSARDARFRRYQVNVVCSHDGPAAGAPVLEELNPTYPNLVGRIEHVAQMGTLMTDFLLIKPGALHRANGGYLLLDARKVLTSPFAWEALKRALKTREIRIESPAEQLSAVSTQSLDPVPIPLDVKVILFGERDIFQLVASFDPDFAGLFKVQADFDDSITRSDESHREFARLIASIVKSKDLRPLDAPAVARMIEESSRMADDSDKLSIEVGRIADIVREADYWAGVDKASVVSRAHVDAAINEAIQRADRVRDRSYETINRKIVLVDTTGSKVGQINGLAVLQVGGFIFGRPNRITARVRIGSGKVTDIEREAQLSGPLHSKGVMILWGFLAGRYALDVPLALSATLVFEQSYGGVDGDSASSTELYALLSALADLPIRQGFAVTGSVNQWGEVQAIGGVNAKIEGFYDICVARGLDGSQGVLIPAANVQHLMLREDVVDAVAKGQFQIHAVSTIDEGITRLTGVVAGVRGADGTYPPNTVNRLVEDKLRAYAERNRAFARTTDGTAQSGTV